jgi:prepilin-type N-terminal cleavage/methylation domain-containing protein
VNSTPSSMADPVISIIIPAYNEEKRIGAAIESLLAQDFDGTYEIIIIDDASIDRTLEIVRRYMADGAMVPIHIVNETHRGTMCACESGRRIAKGRIIVRMDADCIPPTDWLSRGAEYFEIDRRGRQTVSVSGPYDYYDSKPTFRAVSLFIQKYIYTISNIILTDIFRSGGVMIGGNSFMRASALDAIGGFNTDIIFYGDDSDTVKRLSAHGKPIFDRNLIVKSSARRFKNEGILPIMWKYLKGFMIGAVTSSKNAKKKTEAMNSMVEADHSNHSNRANNSKGFTLLELIVVVAIIGLLSTIILASVSLSKERGRFAAGQRMSTSLYSAYGAGATAVWDFNEASGDPVDGSGTNKTATLTNGPTRVTGTNGSGLSFNGASSQYAIAVMGNNPAASNAKWTIAAWVKPTTVTGATRVIVSYGLPYLGLLTTGVFRGSWKSSSGQTSIDSTLVAEPNKWYFLVLSHNAGKVSFYIDGKEVGKNTSTDSVTDGTDMYLGSYGLSSGLGAAPSNYFTGVIDEVRTYADSMLSADIREMYVAGLPQHRD